MQYPGDSGVFRWLDVSKLYMEFIGKLKNI